MFGLIQSSLATGTLISFEIYIQEGSVPDDLRPALEAAIGSASTDVLGQWAGPIEFTWTVVARGFGFRGGLPSTTSLVRGRIPDGCDRPTRERFLRSVGGEWRRLTGCAEDEVIVSARDWSWAG